MTIYWVLAAIIGAAGQTARNAMQRNLTAKIGTVGATQVRFLYGLPFAILFLSLASVLTDHAVPSLNPAMFGFTFCGSVAQILATALMLLAMRETSFAVTTAYTKTEPVQVAIFGIIVLGDALSVSNAISIIIATVGVMLTAGRPANKERIATGGFWYCVWCLFRFVSGIVPRWNYRVRRRALCATR